MFCLCWKLNINLDLLHSQCELLFFLSLFSLILVFLKLKKKKKKRFEKYGSTRPETRLTRPKPNPTRQFCHVYSEVPLFPARSFSSRNFAVSSAGRFYEKKHKYIRNDDLIAIKRKTKQNKHKIDADFNK